METQKNDWLVPGRTVLLARTIHRSSWSNAEGISVNHSYETKQPVQLVRINGYGEAEVLIRTLIGTESRNVPINKLYPATVQLDRNGDPKPNMEPRYE